MFFLNTGDISILEQCWNAICKYIAFMDTMSEDCTLDFGLGDWCPPVGDADKPKAPTAVTDTWYYYVDTLTASKIAGQIGKTDAASYYASHAETIRQAFLRKFVDETTGDVSGSCQTSYAMALQYGIARNELAGKIFNRLVDEVERCNRHIDSGIIGAKYVLQALVDGGRADLAYHIATQKDFPSWGNWIEQGATTLWETWNGDGSRNHHMFSDVSSFFYKALAGINPDESEPGFKHAILKPNPVPGLDCAAGWHESIYGIVKVGWEKIRGELKLHIDVPEGTSATLILPAEFKKVNTNGISSYIQNNSLRLKAGRYEIYANGI